MLIITYFLTINFVWTNGTHLRIVVGAGHELILVVLPINLQNTSASLKAVHDGHIKVEYDCIVMLWHLQGLMLSLFLGVLLALEFVFIELIHVLLDLLDSQITINGCFNIINTHQVQLLLHHHQLKLLIVDYQEFKMFILFRLRFVDLVHARSLKLVVRLIASFWANQVVNIVFVFFIFDLIEFFLQWRQIFTLIHLRLVIINLL